MFDFSFFEVSKKCIHGRFHRFFFFWGGGGDEFLFMMSS